MVGGLEKIQFEVSRNCFVESTLPAFAGLRNHGLPDILRPWGFPELLGSLLADLVLLGQ